LVHAFRAPPAEAHPPKNPNGTQRLPQHPKLIEPHVRSHDQYFLSWQLWRGAAARGKI
jgi:hypothetical protein